MNFRASRMTRPFDWLGLVSTACGSSCQYHLRERVVNQKRNDAGVSLVSNEGLSTLPALQLSANQYSDGRHDR